MTSEPVFLLLFRQLPPQSKPACFFRILHHTTLSHNVNIDASIRIVRNIDHAAIVMHTLTRTALKRVAVAPVSRTAAVSQRYSSTVHDNDPEVLEIEKQRNMDKVQHKTSTTIRNAPGWNEYLASSSEAAVKADRSDHSIHELQSETLEHMEQRHGKEPHTDKVSPKGTKPVGH